MFNIYFCPSHFSPWRAGLLLTCVSTLGCTEELGTVYDQDLGEPVSAVIIGNDDDNSMVVLSNLSDLCSRLENASPPEGDWWVLSAWTGSQRKQSGAFVAFSSGEEHEGTLDELDPKSWRDSDDALWHYAGSGDNADEVKVRLDMHFDDGSSIRRTIETKRCYAPAFNGLQ